MLPLALAVLSTIATHPLLAWLGGWPDPGAQTVPIELRASRCGDGIGAFLTRPVQAGEVLFAIPAEAFISLSTALGHPALGPALQEIWEASSDGGVAMLAGLIAHLQLNSEEPHPYLRMLPTCRDEQNHVLWWSDDEVSLLAGTSAHDEVLSETPRWVKPRCRLGSSSIVPITKKQERARAVAIYVHILN